MPDIQPTNQQPITDDQELAKVLAGVTNQADQINTQAAQVEELPQMPAMPEMPVIPEMEAPVVENQPEIAEIPAIQESPAENPVEQPDFEQTYPQVSSMETTDLTVGDDLKSIREQALHELHPIVDKLNASPEEMFDAYLTLLRATDDQKLIAPAHEAAKNIQDEAHRAQALLNIIREIDFLSQK